MGVAAANATGSGSSASVALPSLILPGHAAAVSDAALLDAAAAVADPTLASLSTGAAAVSAGGAAADGPVVVVVVPPFGPISVTVVVLVGMVRNRVSDSRVCPGPGTQGQNLNPCSQVVCVDGRGLK